MPDYDKSFYPISIESVKMAACVAVIGKDVSILFHIYRL